MPLRQARRHGKWAAMQADPRCPACGDKAWVGLGEQSFSRDPRASEYMRLRQRVLFELWAPGSEVFKARFVLCEGCGFVCYVPRATAEEIDAKYRLIASEQKQASKPVTPRVTRLDEERSAELHAALAGYLPRTGRLLDFGGGSGALLGSFAEAGLECGVVDYTPATVAGVARLGDTLDDLPAEARFEVVLCSHVIEHVAEPVEMARQLRGRLSEGGVLFIEVPLEILGGPPKMREPVTHVNFFCETSLVTTLERAGLEVLDCRTQACLFANGAYRYGVRAIARASERPPHDPRPGATRARQLLEAGAVERVGMVAANPRVLLNPVRSIGKRLGVR
jgi:SAM-dependent methyltransferase